MTDLDGIHAALTALRNGGLVTDRDQLNAAWRDLTQTVGDPK